MSARVYKLKPLRARILDNVIQQPDGCWIWTSSKNSKGYGRITIGKRRIAAHRVSYEEFVGAIPAGLQIDHLCRVHACVNPEHLEPVTCRENLRRGIRRLGTHCRRGHEYTPENTIHEPLGRRCRACSVAYHRTYRAERRRNRART